MSAGWLVLCAALCWPATALAAADNPFVESGGEVLRDRMQIPWYDAETDSLRPITLARRRDIDLSWLAKPIYIVMLIMIAILLAVLAWLIVRIVREHQRSRAQLPTTQVDPLVAADRVEALPFLRERSQDDLLGQARYHYERGNYSEAIIYLFSYQLVELDRSALVRLAKGKTNRQYLREAQRVRPLAGLLERTMVAFEDVFFGRRALDRLGFEACWHQLGQFDTLVGQVQSSA